MLTGRRGELYIVFTCPIVFELLLHPESECESSLPRKSSPAPSRRGGPVHRGGHVRYVFGKPVGTAAFAAAEILCNDLHPECALSATGHSPPPARLVPRTPPPVGSPPNRLSVVGKTGSGA